MSQVLVMILPQAGNPVFLTYTPIETIFVWLNKIIKFLLLT